MSDIICVTNRALCEEDFLTRLEKVAAAHPAAIILREKDLPETEYQALAGQALAICKEYGVPCILHSFTDAAIALGADAIHMPLHLLRSMTEEQKNKFRMIGASCHSTADAIEAQQLGCTYITAGHIFATDCKKGLPGRGLEFLKDVCESVSIPVFAIGGISKESIASVRGAGAKGACIMSGLMRCENVITYLNDF
ncbi:MAG: thiamine phosphate synthase [Brotaphodocola sp.]